MQQQSNPATAKEVDRITLEDGSVYVVLDLRGSSPAMFPAFAAYKLSGGSYIFVTGGQDKAAVREQLQQFLDRNGLKRKKKISE